jgi:hypothetical protein
MFKKNSKPFVPYGTCLVTLIYIFLLGAYVAADAGDFSGTWQGPYYYNQEAYGPPGSLTVIITQTEDSISGTFVSSSGDTGSFTGKAYAEHFIGSWERPVGPFTTRGNFLARLKNNVLVWEGIGYLIQDTGTISGALTRNWVLNTSHWLSVTKDHFQFGYVKGDIWCAVSEPQGKVIKSAVLVTPRCNAIPVNGWNSEDKRYHGGYSFDVSNVENAYPNGIYSFSMEFQNGSKGACFSMLSGSFSNEVPVIKAPLPDTEIDESLPLSVNWNAWTNPQVFNDIVVYFDVDHLGNLSSSQTTYELTAHTIPDNYLETFKVGFNRSSGYYANNGVESHSYIRTASLKVDDYWCTKLKIMLPNGTFGGAIIVGMDVSGITGATLIPPAGAAGAKIQLIQSEKHPQEWKGDAKFAVFADLEAMYPDGVYTLRINHTDTSHENITFNLSGDYPSEIPAISQPAHLSHLNGWEGFSANWTAWSAFSTPGNFISTTLNVMASATTTAFLSSEEVWSSSDTTEAGGQNVPHGILTSGKIYGYQVFFVREVNPGAMKATGNVVFVNTLAEPPAKLTITLTGDGQGKVVSNDSRINCSVGSGDCEENYYEQQSPVLIAVPGETSLFGGWSGDEDCNDNVVNMTENRTCTAQFIATNCPPCSGDQVELKNETFYSGTECNCRATTSIRTGPGVIIQGDAIVNFIAPEITFGADTRIHSGASVKTYTNW